nr:uncharacterized protein LOC112547414 isoform X1 [Pelodiscus sinensis]|eukprot:XP_025045312.1 uncharacterized protein LOC112547414 isoform X1 [Pelodiscus sinensis]
MCRVLHQSLGRNNAGVVRRGGRGSWTNTGSEQNSEPCRWLVLLQATLPLPIARDRGSAESPSCLGRGERTKWQGLAGERRESRFPRPLQRSLWLGARELPPATGPRRLPCRERAGRRAPGLRRPAGGGRGSTVRLRALRVTSHVRAGQKWKHTHLPAGFQEGTETVKLPSARLFHSNQIPKVDRNGGDVCGGCKGCRQTHNGNWNNIQAPINIVNNNRVQ